MSIREYQSATSWIIFLVLKEEATPFGGAEVRTFPGLVVVGGVFGSHYSEDLRLDARIGLLTVNGQSELKEDQYRQQTKETAFHTVCSCTFLERFPGPQKMTGNVPVPPKRLLLFLPRIDALVATNSNHDGRPITPDFANGALQPHLLRTNDGLINIDQSIP